jgi:hypothetical protein
MSLARVGYSVFAARKGKTLTCEGCRKPIEKGHRYAHFKVGFRSRYVHTYHAGCPIRDSARESSKMVGIYSGTENAQDAISVAAFSTGDDASVFVDELKSALESAADEWRSVADEYREAAEASPTGMVFGVDLTEAADSIESAADELTGWDPDEDEPQTCDNAEEGDHPAAIEDCEECVSLAETWSEDTRQSAIDFLDDQQSGIEVG